MPIGYQRPFLQDICLSRWFILATKGFLRWLPSGGNLCVHNLAWCVPATEVISSMGNRQGRKGMALKKLQNSYKYYVAIIMF